MQSKYIVAWEDWWPDVRLRLLYCIEIVATNSVMTTAIFAIGGFNQTKKSRLNRIKAVAITHLNMQ